MNVVAQQPMAAATAMDAVQRYLAPTRLVQALAALAQPGGATVLAGGTDLMLQSRAGRVPPAATLLSIRRVEGLEAIALGAVPDDHRLHVTPRRDERERAHEILDPVLLEQATGDDQTLASRRPCRERRPGRGSLAKSCQHKDKPGSTGPGRR